MNELTRKFRGFDKKLKSFYITLYVRYYVLMFKYQLKRYNGHAVLFCFPKSFWVVLKKKKKKKKSSPRAVPVPNTRTSPSPGAGGACFEETRKEEGKVGKGAGAKVTGAVRAGNDWLARNPGAPCPAAL